MQDLNDFPKVRAIVIRGVIRSLSVGESGHGTEFFKLVLSILRRQAFNDSDKLTSPPSTIRGELKLEESRDVLNETGDGARPYILCSLQVEYWAALGGV